MPWNKGIFIVDLYKNVSNIYKPSVWSAYLKWGLLVTVTGWYRSKRATQLRPFTDLLCSASEF
jgi:hypothetical protein